MRNFNPVSCYRNDGTLMVAKQTQSVPASHREESVIENRLAVKYQYSPVLPEILAHLNASILVSTYQAGKVLVIGVHEQRLSFALTRYRAGNYFSLISSRMCDCLPVNPGSVAAWPSKAAAVDVDDGLEQKGHLVMN
jgi:hypothetical protein